MTERIRLTLDAAARLRKALDADHLSDEEAVLRAFDDGSSEDRQRIDDHVVSCDACRLKLERARAAAAQANSEELRPRIDRLWKGFVAAAGAQHRFREALADLCRLAVPMWQTTRGDVTRSARVVDEHAAGETLLNWRLTEEPSGDLKVVITSREVDVLRGASVVIATRPQRMIALVDEGDRVHVEFVIPQEEWRRMARTPLFARIVLADGDVIDPE